ncbi:MAG TPA: hypothetical protein EYP08_07810 [Pyrodictiaceae archaeon]|nr:hypothetical protein [Pyrodictiaceae archaeon]HIQ10616.1 hypothetical protein [Pyrodictium sp.]
MDLEHYYSILIYKMIPISTLRILNSMYKCSAPCSRGFPKYDCAIELAKKCKGYIELELSKTGSKSSKSSISTITASKTRAQYMFVPSNININQLGNMILYPDSPPLKVKEGKRIALDFHKGYRPEIIIDKRIRENYGLPGNIRIYSNGIIDIRSAHSQMILIPFPHPNKRLLNIGNSEWLIYLISAKKKEGMDIGITAPPLKDETELRPYAPLGLVLIRVVGLTQKYNVLELRIYASRQLFKFVKYLLLYLAVLLREQGLENIITPYDVVFKSYLGSLTSTLWEKFGQECKLSFIVLRGIGCVILVFGDIVRPFLTSGEPDSKSGLETIIRKIRDVNEGKLTIKQLIIDIIDSGYNISYLKLRKVEDITPYREILPKLDGINHPAILQSVFKAIGKTFIGIAPAQLRIDFYSNLTEYEYEVNILARIKETLIETLMREDTLEHLYISAKSAATS